MNLIMKCYKCGEQLEEGSVFCVSCGAKQEQESPVLKENEEFVVEMKDKTQEVNEITTDKISNIKKQISKTPYTKLQLAKLVVGTLLIVIGLINVFNANSTIYNTEFGADFYTYTYQGIVALSNQIEQLTKAISWVSVGLGAMIDFSAFKE